VLVGLGGTQNAVVTMYAHLNLNNLAFAPLAAFPKCAQSRPDDRLVCWPNQSMWVAAPLLTYLLAVSSPASHALRVAAAALLLMVTPLLSCEQGPIPILHEHSMNFAVLAIVLGAVAGLPVQAYPEPAPKDSKRISATS